MLFLHAKKNSQLKITIDQMGNSRYKTVQIANKINIIK